ncbi:translation initiation factor IF-2 [bacterium]|nr:translation initiation factor IF-2 [bacterium]
MRVYEKARALGIESKELLRIIEELGFGPKTASSSIDSEMEAKLDASFSKKAEGPVAEKEVETAAEKRHRARRDAILKSIGMATKAAKTKPRPTPKSEPKKMASRMNVPKTSEVELKPKPRKPKKLKPLNVIENMKVSEFADAAGVPVRDVLRACMVFGVMATANQKLGLETIEAVSEELGYFPILVDEKEFYAPPEEKRKIVEEEKPVVSKPSEPEEEGEQPVAEKEAIPEEKAVKKPKKKKKKRPQPGDVPRPPVVTVMGHVDHGKTTLLDYIRSANVVAGEKGGITQHIGAYSVETKFGKITFIDTPGHAAFTEMRARGADITDIVILIVSQEDGLMPQAKEAIDHARAADVPIVLAVNKMDIPGASSDRIKAELANYGVMVEEMGGDILSADISALKGDGVEHLLELVALQAEMMELKANPVGPAKGIVVEATLDKFRGSMATVLIKEGTLKRGDSIVVGACSGRVRSMEDERGRKLKSAGPSMPVVVTGLNSVPQAGDELIVVGSDAQARRMAEQNKLANKEKRISIKSMTLEDFYSLFKDEGVKELPLVVKADVDGSLEAILGLLGNIGNSEVKVNIVHSGIGAITENDVILAEASGAVVIGFNVKLNSRVKVIAKSKGVDINLYDVIYELSADVKASLEGLLEPEIVEERVGVAEVRQLFKVPKIGFIAGSYVKEGVFQRGLRVDVQRAGEVIGTGKVSGLRRFKDDAKEVVAGFECGIEIAGFKDFAEGDILIAYETKTIKRRLE